MKILCKEKDFYDYIGYASEYGTEDITFDRRNMSMIKQGTDPADNETCGYFINVLLETGKLADIGLWIGFDLYIFRIREISNRKEKTNIGEILSKDFKWKVDLICHRKAYNVKHNMPIEFVIIDNGISSWDYWNNWKIKHFDFFEENTIPILRNTWVPSYVDAQTAYYNIEEWLIAQHNDVDQESKGLTDTDKVINHGFDKKASFRNIK